MDRIQFPLTAHERFNSHYPGVFYLDVQQRPEIEHYLRELGWLGEAERIVRAEPAGSGNMNATVRVFTDARSFILKQSRPWVAKYPDIAAPWDRTLVEGYFYEWIRSHAELVRYVPRLLGFDHKARLLMLEDLGTGGDFTFLYRGGTLEPQQFQQLFDFLVRLHRASTGSTVGDLFVNREMRKLNHEHIFALPLRRNNGLDLDAITPGLQSAAAALIADERYTCEVAELGRTYLADGQALVHGDYFPGSWLNTPDGIRIVDPEFCFFGPPEFDAGCMVAHLRLALQPVAIIQKATDNFAGIGLDAALVDKFAGVEMMRRLIGVAQLPITYGLGEKTALLTASKDLVLGAPIGEPLPVRS